MSHSPTRSPGPIKRNHDSDRVIPVMTMARALVFIERNLPFDLDIGIGHTDWCPAEDGRECCCYQRQYLRYGRWLIAEVSS